MENKNIIIWIIGGILAASLVGFQLGVLGIIVPGEPDCQEFSASEAGIHMKMCATQSFEQMKYTNGDFIEVSCESPNTELYKDSATGSCDSVGCSGTMVSSPYTMYLEESDEGKYLSFVCYANDGTTWNRMGRVFGAFDYVECIDDPDCTPNEICENNICEERLCSEGDEKCEGYVIYACENNEWVWKGRVVAKCGLECMFDSDCQIDYSCENNICVEGIKTFYRFSDNQCSSISILPSEKTPNDYLTLQECEGKVIEEPRKINVYRFQNNQCTLINILSSERTANDYDELNECESNIIIEPEKNLLWLWITIGVVVLAVIIGAGLVAKRQGE